MRNLSFDAERQMYTLDGAAVPRVTEIVGVVTGRDLSAIPADVLAAARERGTLIHQDIESGEPKTPEGKWAVTQLRGIARNEVSGCGTVAGLTFAGTADIVYGDGIDDIKSQSAKDILGWTIQLNLYRAIFGGDILRVLHCPKTGNRSVVPIAVLPDEKMAEVIAAYRAGAVLPDGFLFSESKKPEPESLDLVVSKYTVGELATNAKAILATVKKNLASYRAENYSETNIADAKRDKAELNAAAKKLNDKRIELEREFMRPFNEFKDTIAETCSAIKTASAQIDSVVKEVEEREKTEKRRQIEEFFIAQDCRYFDLERIFTPAWLNKGAKMRDIESEILARIKKTEEDLIVLDRINEPETKTHYLDTLDLDSALRRADEIKANRERLAAIERARAEKAEAEKAAPPVVESAPAVAPMAQAAAPGPEMLERTMWVRGTYEQIVALSDFMNENGIEFRKL